MLYHQLDRDQSGIPALAAETRLPVEAGHGGHLIVRLGARMSVLPMHGNQKELGTVLVNSIKKNLGLK